MAREVMAEERCDELRSKLPSFAKMIQPAEVELSSLVEELAIREGRRQETRLSLADVQRGHAEAKSGPHARKNALR